MEIVKHNVIMMVLTLPHQLLGCGVIDSYCWQHGGTVVTYVYNNCPRSF